MWSSYETNGLETVIILTELLSRTNNLKEGFEYEAKNQDPIF